MHTSAISRHTATIVAFYFGPQTGLYRPGGFEGKLIDLIASGDPENQSLLALGYPEIVAAVQLAQREVGGLAILREIAGVSNG